MGTGWSIVKPYLSGRERRIVVVVLVLQVVDNLALVVFEEAAPGSRAWLTWRDVLHLVDIACCVAILMPIVWSIRHLREAAAADGKAADTVGKLTLFRQFYVMVVAYVYFTRIVVFLLAATCVEINQCVGCTKSFLGDDAAVLARSSGEEPASPRHRAGVASMAWRTTR